jgi:hypothetical protein
MLRNTASGLEIGLPGRISAGYNSGKLQFRDESEAFPIRIRPKSKPEVQFPPGSIVALHRVSVFRCCPKPSAKPWRGCGPLWSHLDTSGRTSAAKMAELSANQESVSVKFLGPIDPQQIGPEIVEFLSVFAVFGCFPWAPGRLSYPPGPTLESVILWRCFCRQNSPCSTW